MNRPMILAAGTGTRVRPITHTNSQTDDPNSLETPVHDFCWNCCGNKHGF